ncbi:SDR family NAD(P)-dependent oxidoreductase [Dyella halodurans]|uniref:SDR family NAD(P)-dependent oxidoreductase n=1 Tax=Dyella halodurans TaxID=1920171 RepID=A0ABV9C2Z9_9GAMM|nr:SDR family NAD(P)-dependent oxidoreductase [Dyella halodurans]
MPSPEHRTALIVGASRGLGLALAHEYLKRGWRVIATVRGSRHTRLHDLAAASEGRLEIEQVDINVRNDVANLHRRLDQRRLDLLFVNAGVAIDPDAAIDKVSTEDFVTMMVTNALSPMRVIEALHALVPPDGTIAAMSSDLGSVSDNVDGGWEVYRASKAALNTLMRSFAARHAGDPRSLLLIAPGWVRTDMGGPQAELSIGESIPRVVDTVSAQAGIAGLQYLDYQGRIVPW